MLPRVVLLAFAEKTKNAQFLPAWKRPFPRGKGVEITARRIGAAGLNRTDDLPLTRRLLYH